MDTFRITGLEVECVGPFEKVKIDFPRKIFEDKAEVHIFTGENGTGKTTLLEMLVSFANEELFYKKKLENGKSRIKILASDCEYQVGDPFWGFSSDNKFATYSKSLDRLNSNDKNAIDLALFAYSGYRRVDSFKINGIQELQQNPLQDALEFNHSTNHQILIQWIANTKTREALAFRRNDFKATATYENAIKKIENAISKITDWKIEFELEENPLNVVIKVNEVRLGFDVLPDGLKSIISWMADLLMRIDRIKWTDNNDVFEKHLILFLDEIDVHLHPAWQRKILPVVQSLFKNSQIFVSTHSPFVVGSIDGAWIYKLERKGKYAIVHEPVLSEDAKSYQTILEEIFGIKEQFGPMVEKDFKRFYELKNEILKGEIFIADEEFVNLSDRLMEQSTELESIVGMEIRQLQRIKGMQEFSKA